MGKTTLALHWAHRVKERLPDGNLYADLRGYGPGQPKDPARVLDGFLAALEVASHKVPHDLDAKAALFRSLLDERSMLIVLDNAATAEQVRPLLPASPGCLVIVTSRGKLSGLVAIDGAKPLTVGLLSSGEARKLLTARLGRARMAEDPYAVDAIIARCAMLPIALAVVAAHAATQPRLALSVLAAELGNTDRPLDALADADGAADVRTVFSYSYQSLHGEAARLFRLLALHPGPDISRSAAASIAGLTPQRTRVLLAELTTAHLIAEPRPGRYVLHDLLRQYAVELAHDNDPGAERYAATHRALDHYLHTSDLANRLLDPNRDPVDLAGPQPGVTLDDPADREEALAWFRADHQVLLAMVEAAGSTGFPRHAWQLTWTSTHFLHRRGHWYDSIAAQHTALAAARELGDLRSQALLHRNLARVHSRLGNFDEARLHFVRMAELYGELRENAGRVQAYLSIAWIIDLQGGQRESFAYTRQALDLHRAAGRQTQGPALHPSEEHLFLSEEGARDHDLAYYRETLQLLRQARERFGEAHVWNGLGNAHHRAGDFARAIAGYERALGLFRDFGDRYFEAVALNRMGDTHEAAGDAGAARLAWRQALEILESIDHPDAEPIRAKLRERRPPAQR